MVTGVVICLVVEVVRGRWVNEARGKLLRRGRRGRFRKRCPRRRTTCEGEGFHGCGFAFLRPGRLAWLDNGTNDGKPKVDRLGLLLCGSLVESGIEDNGTQMGMMKRSGGEAWW